MQKTFLTLFCEPFTVSTPDMSTVGVHHSLSQRITYIYIKYKYIIIITNIKLFINKYIYIPLDILKKKRKICQGQLKKIKHISNIIADIIKSLFQTLYELYINNILQHITTVAFLFLNCLSLFLFPFFALDLVEIHQTKLKKKG